MAYTQRVTVRFADVDYARVVYYPRYFDFCHRVFEDFFADELKVSYAHMLEVRNVGFPSVHAEADYRAPLRFGDVARITLEVHKVSKRAITSRYTVHREGDGVHCATLSIVTAAIDVKAFAGAEFPDDVRAAFERHLVQGATS